KRSTVSQIKRLDSTTNWAVVTTGIATIGKGEASARKVIGWFQVRLECARWSDCQCVPFIRGASLPALTQSAPCLKKSPGFLRRAGPEVDPNEARSLLGLAEEMVE